ncbi:MAG: serine hydrolase domain-containing protein [Terriglobia bacterium]
MFSLHRKGGSKRRYAKIAFWILVVGLGLLLVGWATLIWATERTTPVAVKPLPSCSRTPPQSKYSEAVQQARQQLQEMMTERSIPGMSVAVAVDGKVVWSEGFGFAGLATQAPACPETQFRIASVSKPLTAAAIAQLYQQGRLDLDAPVQRYVSTFPDKGHPITARQLAGHLGGIRHYRDDQEAADKKKHYSSVLESLEKFQNDPLVAPPGTRMHYSSYGYVLLSAVVEGASGEDFLTYMERHVFTPLKMSHTTADRVEVTMPNRTKFYDNTTPWSLDGRLVESPYQDLSSIWAGGGFLSTSEDLVRFGSAHIEGGFLKPEALELLFTPQSRQFWFLGYGMGWLIARDLHLRRAYFHFGAGSGATSFLVLYPDQKVCVALLANLGHARFPFSRIMGIVNPFIAVR